MKIFKCDFCNKTKACTPTTIDNVNYDICIQCKEERTKQLYGKGEQVQQPAFMFRLRRYTDYPVIPFPQFQPWAPPVVYMSGVNVQNNGQWSYTSNGPISIHTTPCKMLEQ